MRHEASWRWFRRFTLIIVGTCSASWYLWDTTPFSPHTPPHPHPPATRSDQLIPAPTPRRQTIKDTVARENPVVPNSPDATLDGARTAISELEIEAYGTALEWNDSIPRTHRPESVVAIVEEVVEKCEIDFPLLAINCDEPPCFAVFDKTGHATAHHKLTGCPAWNRVWGKQVYQLWRTVECEDGVSRKFMMISPGFERVDEVDPASGLYREESKSEIAKTRNLWKRINARASNLERIICR